MTRTMKVAQDQEKYRKVKMKKVNQTSRERGETLTSKGREKLN